MHKKENDLSYYLYYRRNGFKRASRRDDIGKMDVYAIEKWIYRGGGRGDVSGTSDDYDTFDSGFSYP